MFNQQLSNNGEFSFREVKVVHINVLLLQTLLVFTQMRIHMMNWISLGQLTTLCAQCSLVAHSMVQSRLRLPQVLIVVYHCQVLWTIRKCDKARSIKYCN